MEKPTHFYPCLFDFYNLFLGWHESNHYHVFLRMLPKEVLTLKKDSKVFLPVNKANSIKLNLWLQSLPRTFPGTFIALTTWSLFSPFLMDHLTGCALVQVFFHPKGRKCLFSCLTILTSKCLLYIPQSKD